MFYWLRVACLVTSEIHDQPAVSRGYIPVNSRWLVTTARLSNTASAPFYDGYSIIWCYGWSLTVEHAVNTGPHINTKSYMCFFFLKNEPSNCESLWKILIQFGNQDDIPCDAGRSPGSFAFLVIIHSRQVFLVLYRSIHTNASVPTRAQDTRITENLNK